MPLFDIFKKKKTAEKPLKAEKVKEAPKEAAIKTAAAPVVKARFSDIAHRILKTPHVTERATDLNKLNQYVFKVYPKANKVEVKKSVQDLYGVEVISVKMINVPVKQRRLGRVKGFRKGYKKAIVRIKEGQKIEVLPR